MGAAQPKMVTQDGKPVVHFDLDAVENEATEVPFTFTLGGEVFQMASPQDLDWQVQDDLAVDGAGVRDMMRDLLGEDSYERFAKHKLSGKRLGALLDACNRHYGVTTGESSASGRSSKSTRRR